MGNMGYLHFSFSHLAKENAENLKNQASDKAEAFKNSAAETAENAKTKAYDSVPSGNSN
jgi:vacuolar-type H+-ATPase subunit E/Vma4